MNEEKNVQETNEEIKENEMQEQEEAQEETKEEVEEKTQDAETPTREDVIFTEKEKKIINESKVRSKRNGLELKEELKRRVVELKKFTTRKKQDDGKFKEVYTYAETIIETEDLIKKL